MVYKAVKPPLKVVFLKVIMFSYLDKIKLRKTHQEIQDGSRYIPDRQSNSYSNWVVYTSLFSQTSV